MIYSTFHVGVKGSLTLPMMAVSCKEEKIFTPIFYP